MYRTLCGTCGRIHGGWEKCKNSKRSSLAKVAMIAVVCASLQGCFYQTVNQWDIHRATVACGSVENIVEISSRADGSEGVTCKNKNGSYNLDYMYGKTQDSK